MTPSLLRALARPAARLVRPGGMLVIGLALLLTACGSASSSGSGGSGVGNGIPTAEPPAAIALAAYSGHTFVSTKVTVDGKPHALVDKSSVTPTVALVGTTWLFDTQINGDTAASMPLGADQLWLRLAGAPSTYTAFDGCRTGSGTVSLSGSTLTFGAGLWSAQTCQAPTSGGPMVNQIALGSFLEGKVSMQLEGSRLTLTKGTSSFGLHAKE